MAEVLRRMERREGSMIDAGHADPALLLLHVRALFVHDACSRLLSVNEPGGGAPAPRFYLGRTRSGNLWRFRADLPDGLISSLEALCADEPVNVDLDRKPRHQEAYMRLLAGHAPVKEVSTGPAYHMATCPVPSRPLQLLGEADAAKLSGGFEGLVPELPAWQPFLGCVEAGRAVSVCRSVRITPDAHEAGVETLEGSRGKGYARDAVAGWAHAVRVRGAVPLYSTSWDNVASRALAKKLGLELYGADFSIA